MTTSADPTPAEKIDPNDLAPTAFRAALAALGQVRIRSEIEIGELPAPTRLAPWSHALSAEVVWGGDRPESASGRLILLHNPDGVAAWDGTLRIVIFLTAEVDDEIARDPLLPDVAWSWLTDCLELSGASYTALGGTVTSTSSTRFGDIAGPAGPMTWRYALRGPPPTTGPDSIWRHSPSYWPSQRGFHPKASRPSDGPPPRTYADVDY